MSFLQKLNDFLRIRFYYIYPPVLFQELWKISDMQLLWVKLAIHLLVHCPFRGPCPCPWKMAHKWNLQGSTHTNLNKWMDTCGFCFWAIFHGYRPRTASLRAFTLGDFRGANITGIPNYNQFEAAIFDCDYLYI